MANLIKQKRFGRIYERDGGRCWYCGKDLREFERGSVEVQVDHVLPKSKGGKDVDSNLVLSCLKCNYAKKVKTLEEYRAYCERKQSAHARARDLMHLVAAEVEIPHELKGQFTNLLSWLESLTPRVVFWGERERGE